MFDDKIDVAEIMRSIREEIEPDDEMDFLSGSTSNENVKQIIKEYSRVQEFITNTREENRKYLTLYQVNVPNYARFGKVLSKVFIFIAKCVRKCVHYLTANQVVVNHNFDSCINALVESQNQIMKYLVDSENENIMLKEKIMELEKQIELVNVVDVKLENEGKK